MNDLQYKIRENSWLARIAARKLKASSVAMVLGNTVHLWGTSKENFLADECWVRHELCHIKQFREHGFIIFLIKYLWESMRHGYHNNKYEAEARAAEQPDNN